LKLYQFWYNKKDGMEFEIKEYVSATGKNYVREFLINLRRDAGLWKKTVEAISKLKLSEFHKTKAIKTKT